GVGTPRSGAADPGRLFLVPFFWRSKRMNPVAGPEPGMVTRQGARIEHRSKSLNHEAAVDLITNETSQRRPDQMRPEQSRAEQMKAIVQAARLQ
ncbi:MAG: hypothetical protein JWR21_590, partial [Herminiimonas sp.]|nr:hypothetical protein [Herminiimonas sp.]